MGLIEQIYAAAGHAGLLKAAVWKPSDGGTVQTLRIGFSAPDEPLLEGLSRSTEYRMTCPASACVGLAPREIVEIDGVSFQVREVRALGDGTEVRVTLTRV